MGPGRSEADAADIIIPILPMDCKAWDIFFGADPAGGISP
jgi:hypothetical protein